MSSNPLLTILHGNSLQVLAQRTAQSVQCCVTSPPYWGLRDYGIPATHWPEVTFIPVAGLPAITIPAQDCVLGLESDPWAFVGHTLQIFREVHRVLKDDGTLWMNFGDSYIGSWGSQGRDYSGVGVSALSARQVMASQRKCSNTGSVEHLQGLKTKDLCGIPWRVALALQADGWFLRSDIIWHKPNPMPESVTDRPTKAHEYLFLLTKSEQYFYDAAAITEKCSENTHARLSQDVENQIGSERANGGSKTNGNMKAVSRKSWKGSSFDGARDVIRHPNVGTNRVKDNLSMDSALAIMPERRNKRTVWTVSTVGYKEAHFATYPPDLVKPCILAGTRAGDVVLDCFGGSGTTGQVALELGRKAVLIDLGEHHIPLMHQRCDVTPGLQLL